MMNEADDITGDDGYLEFGNIRVSPVETQQTY